MKASRVTAEAVLAQLEAWGSEKTRAIYARHGAGKNQYGVSLGQLRGLAKKLKQDHTLALRLWATGNTDAMILATMIMDPAQLSAAEVKQMLAQLGYYRLVDEFVANVVAKMPFVEELRERWVHSPKDMVGRAGWNLLTRKIMTADLNAVDYDAILRQIEAEMKTAPRHKQEAMNRCLCEIGIRFPEYTQRCIAIGERLGRLESTEDTRGCVSSYAPDWINAVVNRGE